MERWENGLLIEFAITYCFESKNKRMIELGKRWLSSELHGGMTLQQRIRLAAMLLDIERAPARVNTQLNNAQQTP